MFTQYLYGPGTVKTSIQQIAENSYLIILSVNMEDRVHRKDRVVGGKRPVFSAELSMK